MALADAWRDDPLAFLIGAQSARTFLSDSYEKRAVIATASACGLAPDRFAAVLSIAEVDRIITGTDLKTGDLLLADASLADGIEASAYIDDQGYVDRGAVAMRYRQGATVILNQAQRLIPALGRLCQGIEHVFSCHVQTNLYLTPAGSQGFPTHFDNHDVFVIQSEGEKLWRLYDMPVDIPYRGEHFSRHAHAKGELREEFVLKAGDVAYVPRGMMHDAATSGDAPSLHITVGLITRTWADLLLEAVSEVALRQPQFRRSLPAGYARAGFDRADSRAILAELGKLLSTDLILDPAMDLLADNFVRGRAAINSGAISNAAQPIGPTDRFCLEPLAPWRRADEAGEAGRACLTVPGSDLWFTAESKAALTRALDATPFMPSDLQFDHAESLIRRLLAYGLVRRC